MHSVPANLQHGLLGHVSAPGPRSILVCPSQQGIIIHALMLGPPARTSLCLTLQTRVAGTHDRLSDVIKAVGCVMGYFLFQLDACVSTLEVLDKVGLSSRQYIAVSAENSHKTHKAV